MNNTRFATQIHILTLLSKAPEAWSSSEWIAKSICVNPVVVRKELAILCDLGWIQTKKGKDGGSRLNVPGDAISLADIYTAVKNTSVLGKKNNCTETLCPVGKEINKELDSLFEDTDLMVLTYLKDKTLSGFAAQFK